jgi:hypothetical protein
MSVFLGLRGWVLGRAKGPYLDQGLGELIPNVGTKGYQPVTAIRDECPNVTCERSVWYRVCNWLSGNDGRPAGVTGVQ